MRTVQNFGHTEFRQKVTEIILDMLARLSEGQRNIFIWNHYCGYQLERIAEILKIAPSEVETTLAMINSILYQKTRALLGGDSQVDTETGLCRGVTSEEVAGRYLLNSSMVQSWVNCARA